MEQTIGHYLKYARKQTGMSQRAVAATVGVDFTYISKIENDHATAGISEKLLRDLATLYGLDPDQVLVNAGRCPEDLANLLATDVGAVRMLREYERLCTTAEIIGILDRLGKRR